MTREDTILRTSRKGIEIEVIENEVSGVKWNIDTSEHDKQIKEEAYQQGATDMEKSKQIIIDMLLKQIKNITDSLPTCDRYKDYGCPNSVDDCFECMMESIDKIKDNLGLKDQK